MSQEKKTQSEQIKTPKSHWLAMKSLWFEPPHLPCFLAKLKGKWDARSKKFSVNENPIYIYSDFTDKRAHTLYQFYLRVKTVYQKAYSEIVRKGIVLIAEYDRLIRLKPQDVVSEKRIQLQELSIRRKLVNICETLVLAEKDAQMLIDRRRAGYEKQITSYFHGFNTVSRYHKNEENAIATDARKNADIKTFSPDIEKKIHQIRISGAEHIIQYVEDKIYQPKTSKSSQKD